MVLVVAETTKSILAAGATAPDQLESSVASSSSVPPKSPGSGHVENNVETAPRRVKHPGEERKISDVLGRSRRLNKFAATDHTDGYPSACGGSCCKRGAVIDLRKIQWRHSVRAIAEGESGSLPLADFSRYRLLGHANVRFLQGRNYAA